jgi:hypothetical protein
MHGVALVWLIAALALSLWAARRTPEPAHG